jgi:hypothetical protein
MSARQVLFDRQLRNVEGLIAEKQQVGPITCLSAMDARKQLPAGILTHVSVSQK